MGSTTDGQPGRTDADVTGEFDMREVFASEQEPRGGRGRVAVWCAVILALVVAAVGGIAFQRSRAELEAEAAQKPPPDPDGDQFRHLLRDNYIPVPQKTDLLNLSVTNPSACHSACRKARAGDAQFSLTLSNGPNTLASCSFLARGKGTVRISQESLAPCVDRLFRYMTGGNSADITQNAVAREYFRSDRVYYHGDLHAYVGVDCAHPDFERLTGGTLRSVAEPSFFDQCDPR